MASLIDTLIDVLGQKNAEYKKLLEFIQQQDTGNCRCGY